MAHVLQLRLLSGLKVSGLFSLLDPAELHPVPVESGQPFTPDLPHPSSSLCLQQPTSAEQPRPDTEAAAGVPAGPGRPGRPGRPQEDLQLRAALGECLKWPEPVAPQRSRPPA